MTKVRGLRYVVARATLVLAIFACRAHSAPGDLYVADTGTGTIYKSSSEGTKSIFASGLAGPTGLPFDRAGNLFVATGDGKILKISPDRLRSTFASGLSMPGALAFDGAGNLFVTESFGDVGNILKFTPAGEKSTFSALGNLQGSLAFDTSGNLFVATGGPTDLDGGIMRITPNGGRDEFSYFGGPAMAFDSAGSFYFTDSDRILKVPAADGDPVFISGIRGVSALAFDGSGNLFATQPEAGKVVKIAPSGSRIVFASDLNHPLYLAFEPVTEKLRNISARGLVAAGDDVLIGGFILGGNALANNAVVVRAIGPSLSRAGAGNLLPDPVLELRNSSGVLIASNNDWQSTQKGQITARGLAPTDARESAIFATLAAGAYTAVVRSANNATGNALVEIYSVNR